jgi:hypothetical protein
MSRSHAMGKIDHIAVGSKEHQTEQQHQMTNALFYSVSMFL